MRVFLLSFLMISSSLFALEVTEVVYNKDSDRIEIQVEYLGGCFEHDFELRLENCALSRTENIGTVNVCDANIVDTTNREDRCQAVIKRHLNVSLASLSEDVRPVLIGFESMVVLIAKKG